MGMHAAAADHPVESAVATLECALLPRSVFEETNGFPRGYLGTIEKGMEMALRLRLAGAGAVWTPEAEMIGAEDAGASLPNVWQLTRRVDRLAFDKRLAIAVANLRGPER
jgi:hypothetical protein